MNLQMVRNAVRWLFLAAILTVIGIPTCTGLKPTPPVQMPGGDQTTAGVSPVLDGIFLGMAPTERLHFVVQFDRALTLQEIDDVRNDVGIELDGPIPEYAYITATTAERWPFVRDTMTSRVPAAVKVFEFRPEDKLAPNLFDPVVGTVPRYAIVNDDPDPALRTVAVYVRFFEDVPFAEQRQALIDVGATQPGLPEITRGPTGIWAVVIAETQLSLLATADAVRFISPTSPPTVEDIDQARSEVGGNLVDFDGEGSLVAQWEKCQSSTQHPDMLGRVKPIGSISFLCREWAFLDGNVGTVGQYEIGEPIGVDIDEDGSIDDVLHGPDTLDPTDPRWTPLPRKISVTKPKGQVYVKGNGLTAGTVEPGDVRLSISGNTPAVTPNAVVAGDPTPELADYIGGQHPTLVAGIIISNSDSERLPLSNEPRYPGLIPAAAIRSYAWGHESVIMDYPTAIADGARISSNSFGWEEDYHYYQGADPYWVTSEFYDEVISGRTPSGSPSGFSARMLIVGSSGNHGDGNPDPNLVQYHDVFWRTARIVNSAKNVISVGNVSSSEAGASSTGLGVPAYDSGRGPTVDHRLAPILSAPGVQQKCTYDALNSSWECAGDDDKGITSTVPIDEYRAAAGTSFSTPIVSGSAALLSEQYSHSCNFSPAPQDVRALLVHSARDLFWADNLNDTKVPSGTRLLGPDYVFGYGLIQVGDAANKVRQAVTDELESGWVEHRVPLSSTDQLVPHGVGWQLRVTLVWDDPPYFHEYGPRAVTGLLQNDLDLEVIDPDGNRYLPWILDPTAGSEAKPATREVRPKLAYVLQEWRDHANTVEQVVIDLTDPGPLMNRTWTIRVRGFEMYRAPQPYTLVSEMFQFLPGTECGDFSNGTTVRIANPLDVPDTPFAWALFWLAVIILLWLVFETLIWVYESAMKKSKNKLVAGLFALLVLLTLYLIFTLLVEPGYLALAWLMLALMVYVYWRARTHP